MNSKFEFLQLPDTYYYTVIKKMSVNGFLAFHLTCKTAYNLSHEHEHKVVMDLEELTIKDEEDKPFEMWRLDRQRLNFKEEFLQPFRFSFETVYFRTLSRLQLTAAIELARRYKIRAEKISLGRGIETVDQVLLAKFFDVVQPLSCTICTHHPLMKAAYPPERFGKVTSVFSCWSTDYGNEDLLKLMAANIGCRMINVTTAGIVQFIKQWLDGEREIERLEIKMEQKLDVRLLEEELPFSLIYSADCHKRSILQMFKPRELKRFPPRIPLKITRCFIIWRANDISKKLLVVVNSNRKEHDFPDIQMTLTDDPVDLFARHALDFRQVKMIGHLSQFDRMNFVSL